MRVQSVSSTESSFDPQKMGRHQLTNGSFGLSGIIADSDDDDNNENVVASPVG